MPRCAVELLLLLSLDAGRQAGYHAVVCLPRFCVIVVISLTAP